MLQIRAFFHLPSQRELIWSNVERLRIELSEPSEVPYNQSLVVRMAFEKEIALNCQALQLSGVVTGPMENRLCTNLAELINRHEPVMTDRQMRQISKIFNPIERR